MSAQPLEGLNVPSDVWLRIMEKCRVEEILSLEKCCKLFYNLAKSRIVWLKCLQGLEQHEAPDLPPHIPAAGLSKGELRRLVVKATKSSLSWNEIASSPSLLAKSTKEIRIHLKDVNPDEILGEPPTFRLKLFLLPGGKHLLVLWPAGYLQCWSVPEQDLEPQCLWLYPDLPEGASENRPVLLYGLDYDMQRKSRGDVHLLLVNELLQDQFMGERYVDIVCFSPVNNSLKKIYTGKNLEKTYGLPTYMGPGIRGNVFVVYQEIAESPKGTLTINFWNEDTSLTIKEATLDCLELTTEFLICVRRFQDGRRTLAVISISEIFRTINMKTSIEFSELTCTEIPIEQETFSGRRAMLSICTMHWKSKRDQNKINISVFESKLNANSSENIPVAYFTFFKSRGHSPPHLEMLDAGPTKFNSVQVEKELTSYIMLATPSIAGLTPILFRNKNNHEQEEILLASFKFSHGKNVVKLKSVDLGSVALRTVSTEHYSRAVVYATEDCESAVIKYYD